MRAKLRMLRIEIADVFIISHEMTMMKILMTIKKLLMLMGAYHVDVDDDDDDGQQKLAQSCSWHCLSLAQAADKPRLARSWQRNLAFAIKIWTKLLLLVNN